jgi:hypothetical protein
MSSADFGTYFMSRRKKILISARDPGAAGHIKALVHYFRTDARFEVLVAASGAALEILEKADINPIAFNLKGSNDSVQPGQDPGPLLVEASKLLESLKPDIVLTSLSSLGVGIDEALLATARVPTFALQDFWGDVNLGLGVPAGLYLVMDEFAVEFSRERWGVKAQAVGAPKYVCYQDLDILAMRHATRKILKANPEDRVIGWFGQPPDIPGLEEVFQDFLKALALVPIKLKLVLKEHPKSRHVGKMHIEKARGLSFQVVEATEDRTIEDWLAACDLVVTVFSICGLDHAFLSAYSPQPLGCVLYLATNKPVRRFISDLSGMYKFPIVEQGLGKMIEDPAEISETIQLLLSYDVVRDYHTRSKRLSAGNPLSAIAECIIQNL